MYRTDLLRFACTATILDYEIRFGVVYSSSDFQHPTSNGKQHYFLGEM